MNKTTLYQQTRTGKIQQWTIWVEAQGQSGFPEVWIEHGQTDGKKQTTHDVIEKGVNEGKANATTALEQANLIVERKVKKRRENGYVDNITTLAQSATIDPNERLPKNLCFYKPQNSLPDGKIDSLQNPVFTVKRDGMMHIVRKTKKFGVEIYSRKMDLVTDKYPHIVSALETVPHDFILLGEIILDEGGSDNFNAVSQICRSDPDKAIEKQKEIGWVQYYVFDMAYIGQDGKHINMLTTYSYIDRLNIFEDNIVCEMNPIPWLSNQHPVRLCEIINYSSEVGTPIQKRSISKDHKKAMQIIKKRKLEGLVVWDADGIMEDGSAFTFNGKAYRPNVLWKSKPKYEDDFIVRFDPDNGIGEYGTGKNYGKLKNVWLYQLDDNGEEIFICKCGGGLTDEQRDFYTTAEYPRVWRVEYDSIQPKTGSLRFPVFNTDRTLTNDKSMDECIMSNDIRKAREIND